MIRIRLRLRLQSAFICSHNDCTSKGKLPQIIADDEIVLRFLFCLKPGCSVRASGHFSPLWTLYTRTPDSKSLYSYLSVSVSLIQRPAGVAVLESNYSDFRKLKKDEKENSDLPAKKKILPVCS